jgi:hypothetical protein
MRRKSSVPYGETTIMALLNMPSGTKFQLIAKVKNVSGTKILVTDDYEDLELNIEGSELPDLEIGETILIFGEKSDSEIRNDQLLKLNLEWDLYKNTRKIELM